MSVFMHAVSVGALATFAGTGAAPAAEPIKIGVIAESQAVSGSSIAPAAQLAAEEINAKGGVDGRKIEIVVYDDPDLGLGRAAQGVGNT